MVLGYLEHLVLLCQIGVHLDATRVPWQRGAAPNASGLGDTAAAGMTSNAPGNDQSGTWSA